MIHNVSCWETQIIQYWCSLWLTMYNFCAIWWFFAFSCKLMYHTCTCMCECAVCTMYMYVCWRHNLKHKDSFGKENKKKKKLVLHFDGTLYKVFPYKFHILNRSKQDKRYDYKYLAKYLVHNVCRFVRRPSEQFQNNSK